METDPRLEGVTKHEPASQLYALQFYPRILGWKSYAPQGLSTPLYATKTIKAASVAGMLTEGCGAMIRDPLVPNDVLFSHPMK